MFERYNTQARRAVFFARYEASARASRDIDTEHLLLGVIREGEEGARELFASFSVDPQRFRSVWPATVDRVSSSAELPLTKDSQKALAYAAHLADELRSDEIGPLHLLLGILRVPESIAARSLAEAGMTWGNTAETARQLLEKETRQQAVEERMTFVLRASHYALIDRIRESIAADRNRPVSREEVLLTIMDGLSANPEQFPTVDSLDELRVRIAEAIAGSGPAT